jgi:hypothetical protein
MELQHISDDDKVDLKHLSAIVSGFVSEEA